MTPGDDYLAEVRRRLAGMDAGVREDIVKELRSHLADATQANRGDVRAAVVALGDPVTVARRYRDLYGFGRAYRLLFLAVAGFLGVLTVPVLVGTEDVIFPLALSGVFLVAEIAFLLWASVAAGSRTGLLAGLCALAGRGSAFVVAALLEPGAFVTSEGLALFLGVSALLVFLGWLPGTARKAWKREGAEI